MKKKNQDFEINGREVMVTLHNDVSTEPHSLYLESNGFKRAPTERAQYFDLVTDARKHAGREMNETIRMYLVLMLERFAKKTDIFSILLSFNYLRHVLDAKFIAIEGLREVADISLLSTTLFANRHQYRHFSLSHSECIDIGISMFGSLYEREKKLNSWKDAYLEMYNYYMLAVSVLKILDERGVASQVDNRYVLDYLKSENSQGINHGKAVQNFREMYLTV